MLARVFVSQEKFQEIGELYSEQLEGQSYATLPAAPAVAELAQENRAGALEEISRALEQDPDNLYAMETEAGIHGANFEFRLMCKSCGAVSHGFLLAEPPVR